MLLRDALAETRRTGTSVLLHIFEKKKPAGCSVLPASSFSKYAHSNDIHLATREGCR
jgi:hypothetical protein